MPPITPSLWFDHNLEVAALFYTSASCQRSLGVVLAAALSAGYCAVFAGAFSAAGVFAGAFLAGAAACFLAAAISLRASRRLPTPAPFVAGVLMFVNLLLYRGALSLCYRFNNTCSQSESWFADCSRKWVSPQLPRRE